MGIYTKHLLWIFTFSILLTGCDKESEEPIQEPIAQKNTPTVYQEHLSAKEIPALTDMVSEKIGGEKVGLNLKTNNLDGLGEYKVNWDEINLITDTLGIKTYALRLETKNPEPLVFYNIVVTEDTEGNFIDPIIAEYIVDKDFYLQWREDPDKLKDFRGEVHYYDIDGSNFSKKGKTATLSARSPGQAPCPSITFGPSGPRAPYIPNIYCWTYVSYGLCETQINYDTGTSYHNSSNCGAGTGSPIYGYNVSCGSSPTPDRNTSKSGVTGKSPCGGGGGGNRPGAVPINPTTPGLADIGSFVGFLDNKLRLTKAQEDFLEKKPEVELILELQLYLKMKEYSVAAKIFAKAAIDVVMDGGEVDFENEVLIDESFKNTKADCVLKKLLDQTGYFKEVMDAFTNNNSDYRIKFTTGAVRDGADAQTSAPDANGIITITFRPSSANAKDLEIAGYLLHEGVHAQLYRVLASGNKIAYNLSATDYDWLLELNEWWKDESKMPAETAQHDFMTIRYVNPIANAVRKFDSYKHSKQNYLYFGWEGLYDEGGNRGLINMSQYNELIRLARIPLNDNHKTSCEK